MVTANLQHAAIAEGLHDSALFIFVHEILHWLDTPTKVGNASIQRDYTSNLLVALWNPLFSLDITDTNPNIIYTVQVFRITCGQNIFINETTVAGSNATIEDIDPMETYKAAIFAKNNVRGARNGPSEKTEGISFDIPKLWHFITVGFVEIFVLLNESALFYLARNSQVIIPVRYQGLLIVTWISTMIISISEPWSIPSLLWRHPRVSWRPWTQSYS